LAATIPFRQSAAPPGAAGWIPPRSLAPGGAREPCPPRDPKARLAVACAAVEAFRSATDLVIADAEPGLAGAPRCSSGTDGLATLPISTTAALVIARAGERFGG
jgi:hypothetical protein